MANKDAIPLVVKYGGNALPQPGGADPILDEVAALVREGNRVVVVHGGGPEIDAELSARGITSKRVNGLRVTGAEALQVTESVLCATVNKRLVRALQARGVRAAGISGQDGPTLVAVPAARGALGFVGTIVRCEPELVRALHAGGFVPVVAPLATSLDQGALNVNADLAAAAIAGALRARALVLVTNVDRVRRDAGDPSSGIAFMSVEGAKAFAASDACAGGMLPKIEAAIAAAASGIDAYIAGSGERAIARALAGEATRVGAR